MYLKFISTQDIQVAYAYVQHTYKITNVRTTRRQITNITFRGDGRSPLPATYTRKNYTFGPEKPNCAVGCLLYVALVMTE